MRKTLEAPAREQAAAMGRGQTPSARTMSAPGAATKAREDPVLAGGGGGLGGAGINGTHPPHPIFFPQTKSEILSVLPVSPVSLTRQWPLDGSCAAGCALDPEWAVVGKYCRITPVPGSWDVWLCNPRDLAAGLSSRKLTSMLKAIADKADPSNAPHSPKNALKVGGWTMLDGEAYSRGLSADTIARCLRNLGIRRKRAMSEEQRKLATERLRAMREARTCP